MKKIAVIADIAVIGKALTTEHTKEHRGIQRRDSKKGSDQRAR
jgi:hypothetical protein